MKPLALFLLPVAVFAQAGGTEFFEKSVRPILASNCYSCHGPKMKMGGIDFTSATSVSQAIGKSDRLLRAVQYDDAIKMPPSGKLPEAQLTVLRQWMEMGSPWPADGVPQVSSGRIINDKDRDHWAFRPVRDPAPPAVSDEHWVTSPIDRFILAKLEAKKIRAPKTAPKETLIRRATFDLTGLPPTPEQTLAFVSDNSPRAFAKVVDRLLASPQYGERWGRHWLDVARYADSTGMDEDHVYPYAWRYRDYVVNAFNDDMPYNQFVMEQIAGDLLPAKTEAARDRGIIATGFLALGPKPLAQQDRVQMIYDVVDEQIDTTSKAFLGLTIACARCHDHKFDPILTKDYYSLASIFASTKSFRNLGRPGSVSYINYIPLDNAAYGRYQEHRWRTYSKQVELEEALADDAARENALLRPKIAAMLVAAYKKAAEGEKWAAWIASADAKARDGYLKKWFAANDSNIELIAREYQTDYEKSALKWDEQMEKWRRRFAAEVAQDRDLPVRPKPDAESDPFFAAATFNDGPMQLKESDRVVLLRKEWKDLQDSTPPEPAMASGVSEGTRIEQHVFQHGVVHSPGDPVGKTFPVVLAGASQTSPAEGSGRLELASWLASRDNPLTARVMVNRIWQGHFGEALVRTPNNWGKMGDVPVHGELLDYLSSRFIASGYSIKAMHRLIMLSSTYRMSSESDQGVREADPANRLMSRFNLIRMSVEELRDSILALDGGLDLTMGGSLMAKPKRDPSQPKPSRRLPEDTSRRTLYIPVRRGSLPTILSTFDFGDATTAGDGRARTNVAPQALFVMNSSFVIERSKGFASRLLADTTLTDAQRIDKAYRMALGRKPEPAEVDRGLTYMAELEKRIGGEQAHAEAWQSFCHILIASNEFLYLN